MLSRVITQSLRADALVLSTFCPVGPYCILKIPIFTYIMFRPRSMISHILVTPLPVSGSLEMLVQPALPIVLDASASF
jgi:hypothetical protein